jgi:hypothetical protein
MELRADSAALATTTTSTGQPPVREEFAYPVTQRPAIMTTHVTPIIVNLGEGACTKTTAILVKTESIAQLEIRVIRAGV